MAFALISDIHGDAKAFAAVLAAQDAVVDGGSIAFHQCAR